MTSEYPNNPPQLGKIPTLDDVNYPNTQSSTDGAASKAQDIKSSFADSKVSSFVPGKPYFSACTVAN
jgi:hypothetical protein